MSSTKLEGVQILRGYAAVLVVVTHLWNVGAIASMLKFDRVGGLGVDIFFIISGFIMCYALKEQITLGDSLNFLKRRALRIYPIYLLVLIPFLIQYIHQSPSEKFTFDSLLVIGNIFLLPSFFGGEHYKMLVGPAWTLIYELFFYSIFAGAMFLSRSKDQAIRTVMILILSMVSIVNLSGLKGERLHWSNFQYIVGDTLLFNFVLGCICYFVWRKYARPLFSAATAFLALFALTLISLVLAKLGFGRFIALGLPACTIVLVFLFATFQPTKLTKHLVFLGTASYSIYLVHSIIADWKYRVIGKYIPESDMTGLLLTFAGIAAGCIFYLLVEDPISRVLNKPKVRSSSPQPLHTFRELEDKVEHKA